MYNFLRFTENRNVIWVYIVFAAALTAILPIFADLYAFYDKDLKKCYFFLSLNGISLFGGYGERIRGGFALHFSEKKAVIVSFSSIFGMRSQFSLRKDYYVRKISILTECGSENQPILPFIYAVSANILSQFVGLAAEENATAFRNDTIVYEDCSALKISARINVVFNLFTVGVTLFKIILRKIEEWIRKTN